MIPSYLTEKIRQEIEEKKEIVTAIKCEEKIKKLTNLKEVKDFLIQTQIEQNIQLKESLELLKSFENTLIIEEKKEDNKIIPEKTIKIYDSIINTSHQILKTNEKLTYEQMKIIGKEIFERNKIKNKIKTPFIITKEKELTGKIIMDLIPGQKKEIKLTEVLKSKDETIIIYLGEKKPKNLKTINVHYSKFYLYRFESKNKTYVLLSKKIITDTFVKVTGMKVTLSDSIKTGYKTEIPATENLLFLNTIEPLKITYTLEEIQPELNEIKSHDDFAKKLLGKLRHPKWFEKLILAWLLSSKYDNYPLHIGIIGNPSTGKSILLEALIKQIPEPQGIFYGDDSTPSALAPNYGVTPPSPGYAAKCEQIIYIDELFSVIKRDAGKQGISESDKTNRLKTILEHRKGIGRSGKGEISITPTGKLIATTNPEHGLNNMIKISSKLDNAFLSRILWYVQTPRHEKYIIEKQDKIQETPYEEWFPEKTPTILKIMNCFKNIHININQEIKTKIYEKYKQLLPTELQKVYHRYKHHILCLIDGITKLHYITEKRKNLTPTQKDYDTAEHIYGIIISSWLDTIDYDKIPIKLRPEYLEPIDRQIFEYINEVKTGITKQEIQSLLNGKNPEYRLEKLEKLEVIKKIEEFYYPYWYWKAQGLEKPPTKGEEEWN